MLAKLEVSRLGLGRPRRRHQALRADKDYSARAHRAHLRDRGITAVIPGPSDQILHHRKKGSRGVSPSTSTLLDYKNRNVDKRAFNPVKNWRGLATRYHKRALNYRGGVVLAAILLWFNDLGDTP